MKITWVAITLALAHTAQNTKSTFTQCFDRAKLFYRFDETGMVTAAAAVMTNENDNDDFPYSKLSTIWIKNLCVTKYSLFPKTNTCIVPLLAGCHAEVCGFILQPCSWLTLRTNIIFDKTSLFRRIRIYIHTLANSWHGSSQRNAGKWKKVPSQSKYGQIERQKII